MYVLDCEDYSHCISWTTPSHTKGKNNKVIFFQDSFTVHDIDAFASEVMPVLFKEAKYESFQRALYRWGFIKSHRKKKRDSIDGKHSFTYHHTGNMFAKNDWEKCSILSYSKTLKSAKDIMGQMSNTRITFQPLDVDQKRVYLTYNTTFEKKAAGKQRGLERMPEVHSSITSSLIDTLQTRRISNPNLLALDDINFGKSNLNIPSTFPNLNLLTPSSTLYQPATIPLNFPRLDADALMMRPRLNPSPYCNSGLTAVQNLANSEYEKSILEKAYEALLNDTYFDQTG